jgi:hypothetical protein
MIALLGSFFERSEGVSSARSQWPEWLVRLALAGAAILLVLGAFELALRALGYEPIYAVYSHPEIFWRKDALLGWSHEPNSEGTYVGPRPWPVEFEAPVRINSLGLRGPEIGDPPAGGVRVMFLGDSVVAGFEVPWEQTFPARIESLLAAEFDFPVQVINAAVRGYGGDQSFLYYRDRGSRLAPDLVVFIPSQNDAADNVTLHRMRRIFGKGALVPRPDGTLEAVGIPIPDYPLCSEWLLDADFRPRRVDTVFERVMCGVQTRLADRSALFTFFSLRIRQNPGMLHFLYRLGSPRGSAEWLQSARDDGATRSDVAPREQVNTAILRALAREVRKNGAELLLPIRSWFAPELDPRDFASEGVTTFEIAEDLKPEFHHQRDSHLNARGHEILARELRAILAERIRARRSGAGRSPTPGR